MDQSTVHDHCIHSQSFGQPEAKPNVLKIPILSIRVIRAVRFLIDHAKPGPSLSVRSPTICLMNGKGFNIASSVSGHTRCPSGQTGAQCD